MKRTQASATGKWHYRCWLGFPLGLFVAVAPSLFSWWIGAPTLAMAIGFWLGVFIILLQTFFLWSRLFDPMKGVDQPPRTSDSQRQDGEN